MQKKVYPVRPIDPVERRDRVRDIEFELKKWQEDSATFIEFEESMHHSYLTTIQSRALQLALANVEILLYRAYLLDDIQYFTQNNFVSLFVADWDKEAAENVEKCLDAALRTTEMIDDFSRHVKNFKASWVWKSSSHDPFMHDYFMKLTLLQFAHSCGYSAIVAIYVFIIKQPSNTRKIQKYLKSAERCQEQIKLSGEVESFARQCTSVLEELHAEVLAKLDSSQAADASLDAASPVDSTESDSQQQQQQQQQEQIEEYALCNNTSVVDRIDRWGFWGLTGY